MDGSVRVEMRVAGVEFDGLVGSARQPDERGEPVDVCLPGAGRRGQVIEGEVGGVGGDDLAGAQAAA